MPPKKEYKDYRAARKAFASSRSAASRQSMYVRPAAKSRYQALPTEKKYFDSEKGETAITNGSTTWAGGEYDPATANTLFFPQTGDDINNREGRKVHVTGINIRGVILVPAQTNQTVADAASSVRIILVQDQQTNGNQLNAEDVINSGAATSSTAIHMFTNPASFGRFRILKDKTFTLQNPTTSFDGTNIEQSGLERLFHLKVNFKKPVVVHYNATNGGTVADVIDNSFHIIATTSATGLVPTLVYKCRTSFIDV